MNSAYTMTNTMMVTSTFSSSKKSRSFFRVVTCHRQCQRAAKPANLWAAACLASSDRPEHLRTHRDRLCY